MDNNSDYTICNICGSLIDKNNIFNIKGEEICKTCVEKKLEQKTSISPIATFMCSLIPGVGHIFLGKKQKGIFLLSLFSLNIFLFIMSGILYNIFYYMVPFNMIASICIVLTPILDILIYLYSFFDANITRKYIENGMHVEGFIDKLVNKTFNIKNKKHLENKIIDKRLQ